MADDIDDRLRVLAESSALALERAEARQAMAKRAQEARALAIVDLSASALDARLSRMAQMSGLCATLARSPL